MDMLRQAISGTEDQPADTLSVRLKNPGSLDKKLNELNQMKEELPPEQKQLFEGKLSALKEAKQQAFNQYEQDKDANKWGQVAETLGQALTQLGAGIYGVKHNVDLSGLRFNKADWGQQMQQTEHELDRKLGLVGDQERQLQKEQGQQTERVQSNVDFNKAALLKDYMDRQRAYEQQTIAAQKLAVTVQKAQDKGASPEDKAAAKLAQEQLKGQIKQAQMEVDKYNKALAEANNLKEGAKGSSIDKVATILGGEKSGEFRENIKTPTKLFGIQLWKSMDTNQAPIVVGQYLNQAKQHLDSLQKQLYNKPETTPAAPTPTEEAVPVRMVRPDGQVRDVPAEQVNDALKAGYKKL